MSVNFKANRFQCDDCGAFMSGAAGSGSSWAEIYNFAGGELDHEHNRCLKCTERLGPAESNAKPWDADMSSYHGVN